MRGIKPRDVYTGGDAYHTIEHGGQLWALSVLSWLRLRARLTSGISAVLWTCHEADLHPAPTRSGKFRAGRVDHFSERHSEASRTSAPSRYSHGCIYPQQLTDVSARTRGAARLAFLGQWCLKDVEAERARLAQARLRVHTATRFHNFFSHIRLISVTVLIDQWFDARASLLVMPDDRRNWVQKYCPLCAVF